MSRRAGAPATSTPPLEARLQAAAVTCAQHCDYPHNYPATACPLLGAIPRFDDPTAEMYAAVAAVTGVTGKEALVRWRALTSPAVGSASAFLRSELRRWAVANYHRDGK